MRVRRIALLLAVGVALGAATAGAETRALRVRPVAPPPGAASVKLRPGTATLSPDLQRYQQQRLDLWRGFRDVVSRPDAHWRPVRTHATGRTVLLPAAPRAAAGRGGRSSASPAPVPVREIRVAFLRVDFLTDREGDKSTGPGTFDLSGPDTLLPPIDRPPHNRTFYRRHAEALGRYYDVQSFGTVHITGDVWPHDQNAAYHVSDMADFGPWKFSRDIYPAAAHMFRTFLAAADSQSVALGDPIPWDQIDAIVIIHAGSDLQTDVRQDSPLDIPSFTLGVVDTDVVYIPRTNSYVQSCTFIPETINQDGYYGTVNGVLAHECGHLIFGFYDVYDVESGFPVVGYWSLMDSGNLLGSIVQLPDGTQLYATGLLPPSVDPFHRQFISPYIVPSVVDYADTMTMRAIEWNDDLRVVPLSGDEQLILENRWQPPADSIALDQDDSTRVVLGPRKPDRYQYDALLPGSGILAWHQDNSVIVHEFDFPIDTTLRANPDLQLNTNHARLGLSILEGDALQDLGDPGSPYLLGAPRDPWYRSNTPTLSDTTIPNLRPHIGTRPHIRLDFPDDPDSLMRVVARRAWTLPGFPVLASFPATGPALLAVDGDGSGMLAACWAGGAPGTADSSALFAVRADGLGFHGGNVAFAQLDQRPLREMSAVTTGASGAGPALFAVTTAADSLPGGGTHGGQVWLLNDVGAGQPGWPAPLPAFATTPPVIVEGRVYVGAADGRVYAIGLDGQVLGSSPPLFGSAMVTGRLAVDPVQIAVPGASGPRTGGSLIARVAAGGADGSVAVADFSLGTGGVSAAVAPGWPVRVGGERFAPDFLWIDFNGDRSHVPTARATPAGAGARGAERALPASVADAPVACEGDRSVVVHFADKLWAFCGSGAALPGWGHSFGDTLADGLGAGDADGDGFPDVLTQTLHSGVMFVNRSGYPVPGWPKRATEEDFRTDTPPLALDVDGDGRSEIVSMNASGIVSAMRADGKTPDGWPFATGVGAEGAILAADLDHDGTIEIVAPDHLGGLYAYSLPVAGGGPTIAAWTMLGGDPGRSASLPESRTAPPVSFTAGPLVAGTFKAYPNPARRHPVAFAYRVSEPTDVEFRILDASGHEVASFTRHANPTDNVEVWDPAALPAGLYLARVRFRGAGTEHTEFAQLGLLR